MSCLPPITSDAVIIGIGVAGLISFALGLGLLFARYDRALFGPLNEAEARQAPRQAYDYEREDDAC